MAIGQTLTAAPWLKWMRQEVAARPSELPRPVKMRVPRAEMVNLLGSLSTMVKAGVPVYRALHHLGEHAESRAVSILAQSLAHTLETGKPLSRAAAAHPDVFTPLQLGLLRVAEKTGALDTVLESLAESESRSDRLRRQLQSALVYPAMLLLACLLAIVLAPPFLLAPILRLIRDMHVPVPFVTSLLMLWSDALRSPLVWCGLAAAATATVWTARRAWSNPRTLAVLTRKALAVPRVGGLLRHVLCGRLARSLHLQLSSGVGALEALHLAGLACGNPYAAAEVDDVCRAMLAGHPLAEALKRSTLFPAVFSSVVQCGEETGDLAQLFEWLGDLHEDEVSNSISSFVALLEPLLMAAAGLVVGALVVATMLPMSRVLDAI